MDWHVNSLQLRTSMADYKVDIKLVVIGTDITLSSYTAYEHHLFLLIFVNYCTIFCMYPLQPNTGAEEIY